MSALEWRAPRRQETVVLAVGLLIGLTVLLFFSLGLFERSEALLLNGRFRLRGRQEVSPEVAVVGAGPVDAHDRRPVLLVEHRPGEVDRRPPSRVERCRGDVDAVEVAVGTGVSVAVAVGFGVGLGVKDSTSTNPAPRPPPSCASCASATSSSASWGRVSGSTPSGVTMRQVRARKSKSAIAGVPLP